MIIDKIPFEIDFPLKILNNKKINFGNKKEREKLFRRHIYYYKYGRIKNSLLEKRNKIFFSLAKELLKFLEKKYSYLNILNISIFGSSLYSKNPGDFDFLIITKGNVFLYDEIKLIMIVNGEKVKCSVGISIKGIENFSEGVFDEKSNVPLNLQSQIIYRTVISLFRRHIPLIGYDFMNNRKTFLKNGYAQVSDLLNNAYELYYLKNNKSNLTEKNRSRKILSRIYEAISYLHLLENDIKVNNFKKKIAIQIKKRATIKESKKIFNEIVSLYKKKTKHLNKNFRDKKEVLTVLLNENLKRNIRERLESYWKCAKLPYGWITQILEILSKYYYNEDLAIKVVREKFPSITSKNSLDYSKKLESFRKIKVKNLAKRINKNISGKIIADVGGRSDDFVEQIILLKKSIKKAYVTDLCSFTTRSKNPKINFVVQSSLTKMPFAKNTINTFILSMVLHHLKGLDQRNLIKSMVVSLKPNGRIILIEDSYPELKYIKGYSKNINNFLRFTADEKKKILSFYDWFGNRLMRNRDNTPLFYKYRTMKEWKEKFEGEGLNQIKAEFIHENPLKPDIFPPKAILVFQKNKGDKIK